MTEGQLALLVSVVSILVAGASYFAAKKQADQAEKSVELSLQISKSDSLSHFTDRFFDLLKEIGSGGIEEKLLTDAAWAYQFWSLQSTEFYFFHHGILPTFMYSLWMTDLAQLYTGTNGEKIRASHQAYLNTYSLNYDEMCSFYENMYRLAKTPGNTATVNKEIATWISGWIETNRRDSFQ